MIQLQAQSKSTSLLPDMTALLDVIFILLVFMMLTANVAPQLLELELPRVAAPAQSVEANSLTLGLSDQGEFSIDQQRLTTFDVFKQHFADRLAEKRQQFGATPQLLVAADKKVDLENFMQLLGWLAEQGLSVAEVVVEDASATNQ